MSKLSTRILAGGIALVVAAGVIVGAADAAASAPTPGSVTAGAVTQGAVTTAATFDKKAHSIVTPSSGWVVVNKIRPLHPKSWAPKDLVTVKLPHVYVPQLRKNAAKALVKMFAGAKKAKYPLQVQSAYRSYKTQVAVYAGWVKSLGKKAADRQSARPGYSEHQTGLAVDISALPAKCSLAACFGTTRQGKWLRDNAYKYGFILRYTKTDEKVTGYKYEPWHFRYVTVALATQLHKTKVRTLEKFFGLHSAPSYK